MARMEFDYYHAGSEEEFEAYYGFVRQVAREDFELCERAQRGLQAGVYGEGVLNPSKENGVGWYQGKVREAVRAEWERGREGMVGDGVEPVVGEVRMEVVEVS
jgi:hypothetical protein